eukprot:UN00845
MSNYFSSLKDNPFTGKKAIEVGSGTGIVGMTLASMGCEITLTDMEAALEIPEHNVNKNKSTIMETLKKKKTKLKTDINKIIDVKPLLWGDEAKKYENIKYDYVIGSDLIYAKENIEPLVKTFEILTEKSLAIVYLAVIRRFKWEENFFKLMKNKFQNR